MKITLKIDNPDNKINTEELCQNLADFLTENYGFVFSILKNFNNGKQNPDIEFVCEEFIHNK